MEDNQYLVFVEVRYRSSSGFGEAADSIGRRKQAKLRATAEHYLQRTHQTGDWPCRFDVVVLDSLGPKCEWIQNAF